MTMEGPSGLQYRFFSPILSSIFVSLFLCFFCGIWYGVTFMVLTPKAHKGQRKRGGPQMSFLGLATEAVHPIEAQTRSLICGLSLQYIISYPSPWVIMANWQDSCLR